MSDLKKHCWKHESWSKDCFDCHQFHKIARQAAEIERLKKRLEIAETVTINGEILHEMRLREVERDASRAELAQCRKQLTEAKDQAKKNVDWVAELLAVRDQLRAELLAVRDQLRAELEACRSGLAEFDQLINGETDLGRTLAHLQSSRDQVGTLREALRKVILWAESISGRVKDRESINWRYLNEAREALSPDGRPSMEPKT